MNTKSKEYLVDGCSVPLRDNTMDIVFGNYMLNEGGEYLLWYPFCLVGIVVFNNIIKFVGRYLVHYHFSDVGHHSMIYYVVHHPLGL